MQMTGAPRGTPFLGAVAEIESSMGRAGWELKDMPGETIDQKWFHFVYRKPLSGYENDPFFTNNEATSSKDRGNPQGPMWFDVDPWLTQVLETNSIFHSIFPQKQPTQLRELRSWPHIASAC